MSGIMHTRPLIHPLMTALGKRYNAQGMTSVVTEFYLGDMSERPNRPYMVVSPLSENRISNSNRCSEFDISFQTEVACSTFAAMEVILIKIAELTENAPLTFDEPENQGIEVLYIRPGECTYEKDLDQWVCAWQWTAKLRQPVTQRVKV